MCKNFFLCLRRVHPPCDMYKTSMSHMKFICFEFDWAARMIDGKDGYFDNECILVQFKRMCQIVEFKTKFEF